MSQHECACEKCDYGSPERLRVREELLRALEACVRACETEDELMDNSAALYDAYEQARQVLLDPITSFPGGYEDQHYHEYRWKAEDGCPTCEDYREAQKAAEQQVERLRQAGTLGAEARTKRSEELCGNG